MRSIKMSAFMILILLLILISCSDSDHTKSIEFKKASVSKIVQLCNEQDSPRCRISIDVLYAQGNDSVSHSINETISKELFCLQTYNRSMLQIVDSFANDYANNYRSELSKLYKEDRHDATRKRWYEYIYNLSSRTDYGRDKTIIYTASLEYYEGGAHGITQKQTFNFDPTTGKPVMLAILFVKGYEQTLKERLLGALISETGLKNLEDLHANGYLYSMDMFVPKNYIIGKEGITFVYNAFELASYDKGTIELTLDYSDLKDILNP